MTSHLSRRNECRLCGSRRLDLALPMKPSPIGDVYVPNERLSEIQETYPLDLYLCADCGHVQNLDVVDPEILFRDYTYVTSSSMGLVEHYRRYAEAVAARVGEPHGELVVEIGSNDGSLLRFFKDKGFSVLGVDPARRIAEESTRRGIPTIPEFFTEKIGKEIRAQQGQATIIAANNVFAHADNLADVVRGIHALLADDGVFVFEVSYLVDIVERFLFDTIYHEHVSYHSIAPFRKFFAQLGMELFDVQRIGSKGGSIRVFAQRSPEGKRPVAPIVAELLKVETEGGYAGLEVYRKYGEAIQLRKDALLSVVDEAKSKGRKVAGYGASTTVTTLMWQFELTEKLEFLAEDNVSKFGLFSPRCHVPVVSSSELYVRRPDYVVILAWNYAEPIIKRHQRFIEEGGKFLIPLPELRVV